MLTKRGHRLANALLRPDRIVGEPGRHRLPHSQVAGRDNEIDRLWHRVFEELVGEMGNGKTNSDDALRSVTLLLVAHNLERIADRVTNVAEDIVFLETGQVVELG